MSKPTATFQEVRAQADKVAAEHDADVLLVNSMIGRETEGSISAAIDRLTARSTNVILVLATNGGDAHAAYAVARMLQDQFETFTLCIAGDCYSAGTLLALGSHRLIMTDRGRLGPLDVQLLKKDALGERVSGLTARIALQEINTHAAETMQSFLRSLVVDLNNHLSLTTALQLSADMTVKLYREMFRQIDPMKLGEDARALHIADHYGSILAEIGNNVSPHTIQKLRDDYPAHECFIDRKEAQGLFKTVDIPDDNIAKLLSLLGTTATEPRDHPSEKVVVFISTNKQDRKNEKPIPGSEDAVRPDTQERSPRNSKSTKKPGARAVPDGGDTTANHQGSA